MHITKGLEIKKKNLKVVNIFLPMTSYHMFWGLKRTVLLRRFYVVPTTYVLVEI